MDNNLPVTNKTDSDKIQTEYGSTVAVEEEEDVHIHGKTLIVVLSINFIYFAQLFAVVGSGFLGQPISTRFGAVGDAVWLGSVLNILTIALGPPVSQAADYWGRKWFLVISAVLGCVGSIIVSRAQSIAVVILGFTIIGAGFGATPLLHAVVSEVLPRKYRPWAQGTVIVSGAIASIVCLAMGGSLLRHNNLENYRIYFYVVAAANGIAAIGNAVCYNPPPRELQVSLTLSQKLRKLDWIGYFLFTPGLILFCIALSWSRNPYQWTNAHILTTFIIGTVLLIVFVIYQWRINTDGMIPHRLFGHRNFAIALLCTFVEGLAYYASNSYYVLESRTITGTDILVAGMQFAMLSVGIPIGCYISGLYSVRRKSVRLPANIAFILIMVFNIVMATLTPRSPKSGFWGYPLIVGFGIGSATSLLVVAQLCTPPDLISVASGLLVSSRALGATVALSVNNALFNNALADNLGQKVAAATIPLGLPQSSLESLISALNSRSQEALMSVPGATPEIISAAGAASKEAYSIAFRNCWILAACFAFVALVGTFFLVEPKSEFTSHIDAPVEVLLAESQEEAKGPRFRHTAGTQKDQDA